MAGIIFAHSETCTNVLPSLYPHRYLLGWSCRIQEEVWELDSYSFSKEQISERITGAVEAADPESLARKERLDFTKWIFGRGGQG